MAIIPFHGKWYSDIIVYDERKKYFYMWARKNRPFLDDEIRNMNLEIVDQIRRSMQHTYGTVGSPTEPYSNSVYGVNNGFKVVQSTNDTDNNFTVKGGGSVESPAVLFAKGFYIFTTGDIDYKNVSPYGQSDNSSDPGYTETPIPDLNAPAPGPDRIDVVYIDLHFAEASAVQNPPADVSEYTDTTLKNPIIGTETANRARAVFDIRVWENWRFKELDGSSRSPSEIANLRLDENIFTSNDFLGSIETEMATDPNPVNKHYRIPIAILNRPGGQHEILDENIVNLLDLYDKRILNLSEVTYRMNHGGFTQRDVDETLLMSTFPGMTGLVTPRYPNAAVNESAYATGANNGIGTEAFNSDSVTPRVLDDGGKFAMGALLVGHETGTNTYPIDPVTGPEQLFNGEIVSQDISAKSIYVGYDRGITGLREYKDRINVNMQGMTGDVGLSITNTTGETGTHCFALTTDENSASIDYAGRIGVNTKVPGWSGPDAVWETTDRFTGTDDVVNIAVDVNASERVTQHLFVDKDAYVKRDSYGPSWKIPGVIDRDNPVLIGITGMPKFGFTGSPASVQVVPGIAVIGVTGTLEGYTGTFGFYEAYDANGERVYTIGSKGDPYDRQVLSLYGTSERAVFEANVDFNNLPDNFVGTPLQAGDTVTYSITLKNGNIITKSVGPLTLGGYSGLAKVATDINTPGPTGAGFHRFFEYQYAKTRAFGDTGPIQYLTYTGMAEGAAVLQDENYLRFLVKSMPEIDKGVDQVVMSVNRAAYFPDLSIDFIQGGFFGSGLYGGDVVDLRFVKFDLGEAADAFLFNGDVFFNGGGLLNKVTFSPIAMFRNDIYVYGKVVADRLLIQLAKFTNLMVDRDIQVNQYTSIVKGLALGFEPYPNLGLDALKALVGTVYDTQYHVKELINGGLRVTNIGLHIGQQVDLSDFGIKWELESFRDLSNVVKSVVINGTSYDPLKPFGIHIKDDSFNVNKFNLFVVDGLDSHGTVPTPFDVLLWIKGDLRVGTADENSEGSILAKRITLGLGATAVDSQYILSLKSGTAYIESLTVKSIQYDATNPTSAAFFTNPQNIAVVQPAIGDKTFNKTAGILRTKEFSFDTYTNPPAVLANSRFLGGINVQPTPGDYSTFDYPNIASEGPQSARWASDTLSFTQAIISAPEITNGGNDVVNTDFNNPTRNTVTDTDEIVHQQWEFFRDNFSRIIVANLGTMTIKWYGYTNQTADDDSDYPFTNDEREIPISVLNASNQILGYTFNSSLFKVDQSENSVFDWQNPVNNFVTNIRASFNDNKFTQNTLYNLNKMLGIFIPFDSWLVHEKRSVVAGVTYYERVLYYPYSNRIDKFNVVDFDQQYPSDPGRAWQTALYPRIIEQKMFNVDTQNLNVNSQVKIYEGTWNVDVVMYPTVYGSCNNLVGDLKISYM